MWSPPSIRYFFILSPQHIARKGSGMLTFGYDHFAVDNHIGYPFGILVGVLPGGFVNHPVGVKNRNVSISSHPEHTSVRKP